MIDTVVLSIPMEKIIVLDMQSEGVPSWDLQSRTLNYSKYIKNASTRDKELGIYLPRLTYYHSNYHPKALKIEFSCPKLIRETNLHELENTDFESIVTSLKRALSRLGIVVSEDVIRDASITSLHYSKNILLEGGYTSRYVINELSKIDLSKIFDLAKTRFINDGQSLYAFTKAHSLVIYDKVADLNRGSRSIDQDQPARQLSLFEELDESRQEILRFEVRLGQKQKLNSLFVKLGLEKNPTFKYVFDSKKAERVLGYYWDNMVSNFASILFSHSQDPLEILNQITMAQPDLQAKELIFRFGLMMAVKDQGGIRKLRSVLSKQMSNHSWYSFKYTLKETAEMIDGMSPRDWYKQVENGLKHYIPFRVNPQSNVNKSKV